LLTGASTLLFGGLLGGLVKLLLEDVDRHRAARADEAQFLRNVLADLKSVYDQTERARVLIAAHRSAATYRDEMKNVIDARVKLRNVGRALHDDDDLAVVRACVKAMDGYLTWLLGDYEDRFKEISRQQRVYESQMAAALGAIEKEPAREPDLPENKPWRSLSELESIEDLLDRGDGTRYEREFVSQLDEASRILRRHLAAVH
jgi:hypothetical protein